MRTLLDNSSGSTVFIPESDADTRLLYHLMNCVDLTQFSEYLSLETRYDNHPVTIDIGVPVELLDRYPVKDSRRTPSLPHPTIIGFNRESSHAGF